MALKYSDLVASQTAQPVTQPATQPTQPQTTSSPPSGLQFNDLVAAQTATPPNPSAPVPAADLNVDVKFPAGSSTSNPTPFVGSLGDSLKYFQDLYNKQATEFEAAQKERNDLKKTLGDAYGQLGTLPDVYKQTEQSLGIPKMYEDLNKINLQVADLAGAYDKEFARVETQGIQSGTPAIFYQGDQAAIQRQKAVEIGALSVRQAAMAGNLDLANQRAAKTVELQFAPIENKINQTLQFLDLNYQDMTAAEKRKADTLQTTLAFQSQQIQQQKEDKTNALMAGVSTKFFKYPGSELVFDTQTGEGLTYEQYIARGGKADFSNITEFNPMETQQVLDIASKYPDAGIKASDTLASAKAKLSNSRIYQDQVRGPVGPAPDPLGDMYKMLQIEKLKKELGMGSDGVVDSTTDAKVKAILASKPGDGGYGDTYKAVASQLGAEVANKYDSWYQQVFNQGVNPSSLGTANTSAQVVDLARMKDQIGTISKMNRGIGFSESVGPNLLSRTGDNWLQKLSPGNLTGKKADFISTVETLRAGLTIDKLQEAKAGGATFGALSEGEWRKLEDAASRIGTWVVKNKDGKVTGYDVSQSTFIKEWDTINNFAKLDYVLKGGSPTDVGVQVMPDGTFWTQNSDGTMTKIE